MFAPVNHFKLGLFVLAGIAAAALCLTYVGVRSMQKETLAYHTFFNESVQGLDVGSPVKYRGVTIGHVAGLEIAPDRRHVDVINELDLSDLERLGLTEEGSGKQKRFRVPPDLRAQLGSQGITGVKYVQIDFFDPRTSPPPELPFPSPSNTIPTALSMMKNLEDSIVRAVDALPELTEGVLAVVTKIDGVVAEISDAKIPNRAAEALASADLALKSIRTFVARADKADLPAKTAKTVEDLDGAIVKLDLLIDELRGDEGLVGSAKRATDAFGDMGKSANGTARELEDTLREVRETSSAIKSLAEAIERDPDMLVKGRAKVRPR